MASKKKIVQVGFVGCEAGGEPFEIEMMMVPCQSTSDAKCRRINAKLILKIKHECGEEPPVIPRPDQVNIDGVVWGADAEIVCNKCSTLVVIDIYQNELKCKEPIEYCRCEVRGEPGCPQESGLVPLGLIEGDVCLTTGGEILENDARHNRKIFRIYVGSRAVAESICKINRRIIFKTASHGNIEFRSVNTDAKCPYITGYGDDKEYKNFEPEEELENATN